MAAKKAEPKTETKTVTPAPGPGPQQTQSLANVPVTTSMTRTSAPAWLVEKMKAAALANQMPRGLEKLDRDDIIYPRLMLCQGTTPLVQEGKARVGDIVDNLTGEVLTDEKGWVEVVPVVMTKMRMYMLPMDQGGGIKCRADNAQDARPNGIGVDQAGNATASCADCVHKDWDETAEKDRAPKCTIFWNVVCVLPQFGNRPIVWSGKSTNLKVMKRMLSLCKQTNADFFAHSFKLSQVEEQNSANIKYRQWTFERSTENGGWATEESYLAGESLYNSLEGKTWTVDASGEVDDSFDTEAMDADAAATPAPSEAPKAQPTTPLAPAAFRGEPESELAARAAMDASKPAPKTVDVKPEPAKPAPADEAKF